MRLAGLRNTSMLDYPDNISAVVFTRGCNFHCSYCHNSHLIPMQPPPGDEDLPEEIFFNLLEKRQNVLDGVTITGGEPLLQPDLKEFINKIRKNYDLKIKLDTNGSSSKILKELIEEELLDYLALDLKFSWDKYHLLAPEGVIAEIKKSIKIIMNSNLNYEFRTTAVPGLHDVSEIEKIAETAKGADRYYIQNFRPRNTLDPKLREERSFAPSELKLFKKTAEKYIKNVQVRD